MTAAAAPAASSDVRPTILVVEDHSDVRGYLRAFLEAQEYAVEEAGDGHEAVQQLARRTPDLMLLDMRFPRGSGLEVLRHAATHYPALPVIIVTETATLSSAMEASRLGAHDLVEKPVDSEQLLQSVQAALAVSGAGRQVDATEQWERYGLVGRSPAMTALCRQIDRAAPSDVTVLIEGESGTGKESVARAIHANGPRRSAPFVAVNCAALPDTLIENELFGHARGAFTGADTDAPGRFTQAHGGTLLLDEIGEMALTAQSKLLRVMESGVVDPLGGRGGHQVDVRVIAATHRRLRDAVADREFREDLFYRLNVVRLRIPPLRERPEDIADIVRHLLRRHARDRGEDLRTLDPGALRLLLEHTWPGNVRELRNVVLRVLFQNDSKALSAPAVAKALDADDPDAAARAPVGYKDARDRFERSFLTRALIAHDWRVRATAESIGLDRVTLWRKMKQLGIEGPA